MSLQMQDGTPWWRTGYKSFSEAVFDSPEPVKQPAPEPPAPRLWNSPCTLPDQPGVYEVMAGASTCIVGWTKKETGKPRVPIRRRVNVVMIAHWNGVRWGSAVAPLYDRHEPGYRDSDMKLAELDRRFNPRQDYPWREVGA